MDYRQQQGLSQGARQHLALSTGMLQALEILRAPLQELRETVTQALYENPMLETDEAADTQADETFTPVQLAAPQEGTPPEERADEAPLEVRYGDIWRTGPAEYGATLALAAPEQDFTGMLLEQLGALPLDATQAALARAIIYSLDDRGYFADPPADIAALTARPLAEVMQALYLVQSLQPAGVAAQSLQECLTLQLAESNAFSAHTLTLVRQGLPLLAKNDMAGIARLLGTTAAEAEKAAAAVRALNPIPSRGYAGGTQHGVIIPDAAVKKTPEGLLVTLNEWTLPRLVLSPTYTGMLQVGAGDAALQSYLVQKQAEGRELMRAVAERKSTLERLLKAIVARQPRFFEDGSSLVPMTMAEIAADLELHNSTISRAVQNKYIVCAAGTIELKSLFTGGVATAAGGAVSSGVIRRRIKALVDEEDPAHPLADEGLCRLLEGEGIRISRRTVAKYRAEMGIPGTAARRRR